MAIICEEWCSFCNPLYMLLKNIYSLHLRFLIELLVFDLNSTSL